MKAEKVDHISVAVRSLDKARQVWEPVLGRSGPDEVYVDESEGIRVARYVLAGVGFELMEPTSPESPVAEWIETRGEGVMVVSFHVKDTAHAIEELESRGYPVVAAPGGDKVRSFRSGGFSFLHPRRMNGVLLEVIDCDWEKG